MKTAFPALPALLLLLPAASPAGPLAVHEWDARPADPRSYLGRVPHGSAARLVARLPGPVASASFHWQTNGMGGLWWDAPAECLSNAVSVVWTPAMDTGADEVRAFFRIEQPEGPDYSAFCHLAMLDSPGFVPNALPWPVRSLDFGAVAWTNAPWLLSEVDPTVPAWAKAAAPPIPEPPDLSPYATTSLVASLHPPFQEWRIPARDAIRATAVAAGVTEAPRLDALARSGHAAGYSLAALRTVHAPGGMDSETEVGGSWRLVGDTAAATLSGATLSATAVPGAATVEFAPADGADAIRATLSMQGASEALPATAWPAGEDAGTWRAEAIAAIDPGTALAVYTNTWNGAAYVCTNGLRNTLRLTRTAPNPDFYDPALAEALRVYASRLRWRNDGGTIAGGLLGAAPHYVLYAKHTGGFPESSYQWCTNWEAGAFAELPRAGDAAVAEWGDIALRRVGTAIPDVCVARFLRASELAKLSASQLFRTPALALTQHGSVCNVELEPRAASGAQPADLAGASWDDGWFVRGSRETWLNGTFAAFAPLSHSAHGGDSGHPCFIWVNNRLVPVGLFHWADGSAQCLLSDALLDKIDAAIRRDSGGAESLTFHTAEELQ